MKHKVSSERVNIVRIEDEESSSSSSMSLYNIESNKKDSKVSSRRSPTLVELDKPEEVHSSLTKDKNPSCPQFMCIVRLFGKLNRRRIMIKYEIKYSLLCVKYCLVKKNHVYHLKDKQL